MKKNFKRRDFIKKAGVAAAAATAVSSFPAPAIAADRIEVNCVGTWGRDYPGLGTGGQAVSQRITDLSDGRIVVNHFSGVSNTPNMQFDSNSYDNSRQAPVNVDLLDAPFTVD